MRRGVHVVSPQENRSTNDNRGTENKLSGLYMGSFVRFGVGSLIAALDDCE